MGLTVNQLLGLTLLFLFQNPSLDSPSPKERQDAIEKMAVLGNREAIPKLAEALKKEPKSDIRASMVAGFRDGRWATSSVQAEPGPRDGPRP